MLRISTGVVLVVIGAVWILQALDIAFAPKSFMTGDGSWGLWGAVAGLAGIGFIWSGLRSRRRHE